MNSLLFQYCPKLAVFSADHESVLLCRRKGEADYDKVFSFIGGKMEHDDETIIDALRREKTEEVGDEIKLRVLPYYSVDTVFTKNDGNRMILPHYYAVYVSGDIRLNEEYSEYRWAACASLKSFEPKISNIAWIAPLLRSVASTTPEEDMVVL